MKVESVFTNGVDFTENVFDQYEWKYFDVLLKDHRSDKILYQLNGVEAPAHWSQQTVEIMASKYFRRADIPYSLKKSTNIPENLNIPKKEIKSWPEWILPSVSNDSEDVDCTQHGETSVKQVFHRLAGAWAFWGKVSGMLDIYGKTSDENLETFYNEIIYMLYHQIAAPNSPQFFNTGVWWAYGMKGKACGHSYADFNGEVHQSKDLYSRSQAHACFILGIEDNLLDDNGIYDLLRREARIFKLGSGAGTNFSNLRAEGERLSGGGTSSGLISFLRIFDRAADCIKSGGITRRAAKMLVVDSDHPDILEYINWKSEEEKKAKALIDAGYDSDFNGEAYKTVSGQNGNNSIAVSHEFMKVLEEDGEWYTWWRKDKARYTDENGNVNWKELKQNCKPAKTIKASTIWNKMIDSAWKCADPAIHFNGVMNDWNTLAEDGRIQSTNPCLTGDTLVYIVEGGKIRKIPIAQISNPEIEIIAYDFKWQKITMAKAKNLGITRRQAKVIKLKTNRGEIKLTPDHEIMTNKGWLRADKIQERDLVYNLHNSISETQWENELRDLSEYPNRNDQKIEAIKGKDWEVEEIEVESVVVLEKNEDVYDLHVPKHHCFFTEEMLVSNCSEYISLNDTACNLASINVAKLFNQDRKEFDVKSYKHAIKIWQMILEITNHMAQLPSELVSYNVWKYRSTGLGPANLGTLLMMMGLPYDGQESRAISASLMGIMTGHSYAISAQMADDLGPFPGYENNRKHMLKVIKNHRCAAYGLSSNLNPKDKQEITKKTGDYEDLQIEPVPLTIQEEFNQNTIDFIEENKKCWDEAISLGGSFGFRNSQVTVCAPTGCITPDSMILSSDGLLPISEMGDCFGEKWQNTNRTVAQEKETTSSDKFYINGISPTIRVQSDRGHSLQATFNHQIRVINEDGDYVWKKMEEVEEGDLMATRLGGHEEVLNDKEYVDFVSVDLSHHSVKINKTPEKLNEDMAEIIGLYQGDGYVKDNYGLRFVVNNYDKDLSRHIESIAQKNFGSEKTFNEIKVGCFISSISSRLVARWWRANDLAKPSGNNGEGAAGAFIPNSVLKSKTSVLCAFLRGLFEVDGTVGGKSNPTIELSTVSYTLSKQVFIALESLGIKAHWSVNENPIDCFGTRPKYRVRVSGVSASFVFAEKIGFITERKKKVLSDLLKIYKSKEIKCSKNTIHHIGLISDLYDKSLGLGSKIRQDILVRKNQGKFNVDWAKNLISENSQLKDSKLAKLLVEYPNLTFVRVNCVEYAGESETFDISVPHRNTYIANGIISHNTISFIMGCDSTGIEPCYALVTYKTLAGGGLIKMANNSVKRALENLNSYTAEEIEEICEFITVHGHVKGSKIKEEHEDIFKCAASPLGEKGIINWEGHIRMLAVLQSFVSGGISKTINMPESSTHVDISEAWRMAYKLGCKGISIYRDNCKMSAPLNIEDSSEKEKNLSDNVVQRITNEAIISEVVKRKESNSINIQDMLDALGITNQEMLEAQREWGKRKRPGDVLTGLRFRIKIGQAQGYVQIFVYPDGRLCEFFLTFGNPGSSLNNMLECWSIAFSIALQRGESLHNLCSKYINVEFEPKGFTGRKDDLRRVTSPVDYIVRLMLMYFDHEGYIKDPSIFTNIGKTEEDKENNTEEGTTISGFEFANKKDEISDNTFDSMQRSSCPKCGALVTGGTDKCPVCPSCGYFGGCG